MGARMTICLAIFVMVLGPSGAWAAGKSSDLAGRWALNQERTAAAQPDNSKRRDLGSMLPHTTISVGGIPLPTGGGDGLPPVAGTAKDPKVLRSTTLTIEPADSELRLGYDGGQSETLKRGDDQGMFSRWNRRKLTSRYETTSRTVSQVYQVQRDGSLLVTVKLNPDQGPKTVHKRVFDRVVEAPAP